MKRVPVIVRGAAVVFLLAAAGDSSAAEDAAPAPAVKECTPAPDTKLPLGVRVNIPYSQNIGGVVVRVDYPADKVMLPGSGPVNGPGEGIEVLVEGASSATNDLGTGVRVMVAQAGVMEARDLVTVTFTGCEGAAKPTPADFTCTVEQVRDSGGNPVKDATCAVTTRTSGAAPAAEEPAPR
jgi:hypothetical protein